MAEGFVSEFHFGENDGTMIGGDCFKCGKTLDVRALVCPDCGAPNLYYKSGLEGIDFTSSAGCGGCGGPE